jgi:glycosyltransferase domain-containing protein
VCLTHLRHVAGGARVVISDHSPESQRGVILGLVDEWAPEGTRVIHHPQDMHFLERLADSAERASTDYVVVHADDDFMLPGSLHDSVEFLDAHPDHVACQGRTFFFHLEPPARSLPSPHRSLSRREDVPHLRVVEHCRGFTPTLYAVTRREAFVRANRGALEFTDNVIFWQYLSSCLLVLQGKLEALDSLYYLRLDNPHGWRATLVREADPSHWPYLVVAPNFSAELERFKNGLSSVMSTVPEKERSMLVDKACLGLVRRAFLGAPVQDQAELSLLRRLLETDSREAAILRYCSALAARGLDEARSLTNGT